MHLHKPVHRVKFSYLFPGHQSATPKHLPTISYLTEQHTRQTWTRCLNYINLFWFNACSKAPYLECNICFTHKSFSPYTPKTKKTTEVFAHLLFSTAIFRGHIAIPISLLRIPNLWPTIESRVDATDISIWWMSTGPCLKTLSLYEQKVRYSYPGE